MRGRHQQQIDFVLEMKDKPRLNVPEKKNCRLIQEIGLYKFI